jgi:hypothetical protein
VALYPDSLLSQVLMASTYPLEVVQASRWSQANPGLMGEDAVRAVERMDWDPSVKSLTAFPQVLVMMDERIEWTERLGEAFLVQQGDVLDTVQDLRHRAEAAGTLRSSDWMRVAHEGEVILIREPAPNLIYVPYYNPVVAYGPWWWPDYPPVYWALPRAYYVVPAHQSVFVWGSGIAISTNFFFGRPDWHYRHVTVVHNHVTVVTRNVTTANVRPAVWEHNSAHRRGAPFRNAEARQRFDQTRAAPAEARREDRRIEGREPAVSRVAPNNDGNRAGRAPANRNDGRAGPVTQPETRGAQPQIRSTPPEARHAQPEGRGAQSQTPSARPESRGARPERSTWQADERRAERRDTARPQVRNDAPRPTAVAPVTPAPAPAATTPAAPRQPAASESSRRAEARNNGDRGRQQNFTRESGPAPRPAASNQERGGSARDRGNPDQRERSVGRRNNDRS